ncbi:MAG: helix-turn-helix domain-containing protein [Parvularculaceae bacterium]
MAQTFEKAAANAATAAATVKSPPKAAGGAGARASRPSGAVSVRDVSGRTASGRGVSAADGTTRARIERAALELFAARGVDAATTREIALGAGLSEGALYRHFASKEEIAQSLFATIHERLARLVREAGAAGAGIEETAGAIVDAYCQTADEDWTLFSYHLLSTARFLPTPPGDDNPVAAAEDVVAAAMRAGEIPRGEPMLVAAMALGVVLQPALHKAYGRFEGPLSAHSAALKRGVVAVLKRAGE